MTNEVLTNIGGLDGERFPEEEFVLEVLSLLALIGGALKVIFVTGCALRGGVICFAGIVVAAPTPSAGDFTLTSPVRIIPTIPAPCIVGVEVLAGAALAIAGGVALARPVPFATLLLLMVLFMRRAEGFSTRLYRKLQRISQPWQNIAPLTPERGFCDKTCNFQCVTPRGASKRKNINA